MPTCNSYKIWHSTPAEVQGNYSFLIPYQLVHLTCVTVKVEIIMPRFTFHI